MAMAEKPKGLRVVDDPTVKDLYANKFIGTMFDGGALEITLGVTRYLPERTESGPPKGAEPEVQVSARLALSPAAAVELTNALAKMLNTLNQIATSRPTDQKPH
jgi:hypothetical protein